MPVITRKRPAVETGEERPRESEAGRRTLRYPLQRAVTAAVLSAALSSSGGCWKPQEDRSTPKPSPLAAVASIEQQIDLDAFVRNSPDDVKAVRSQMLAKIHRVFPKNPVFGATTSEGVVAAYAKRHGFDAGLYLRRCTQLGVNPLEGLALEDIESSFDSAATSGAGAEGRAQLMPATGKVVWAECAKEFVESGDFATWCALTNKKTSDKSAIEEWDGLCGKRREHVDFLASYESERRKAEEDMRKWDREARACKKKEVERLKKAKGEYSAAADRFRKFAARKGAIPGEWAGLTEGTYNPRDPNQANWIMLTYCGRDVAGVVPPGIEAGEARKMRAAGYNMGHYGLRALIKSITDSGKNVAWGGLNLPSESRTHGERLSAYYDILSQITHPTARKQTERNSTAPPHSLLTYGDFQERALRDQQVQFVKAKSHTDRMQR